MRLCAVIPTYNNPSTIEKMVSQVRAHVPEVIVVDDGCDDPAAMTALNTLASSREADVVRRPERGGKGAAVKDGLRRALARGFTHALQIDADDQHEITDIPRLIEAAQSDPTALVLAAPQFDERAPKGRMAGRQITLFWTRIETIKPVIDDPMCGFRIYPLRPAVALNVSADAMDFDPEIAVRLYWAGLPVINVPSKVRYVAKGEGGVSHFRMFKDNVLISWMHTRLVFAGLWRLVRRLFGHPTKAVQQ